MKSLRCIMLCCLLAALPGAGLLAAQEGYHSYEATGAALQQYAQEHPDLVAVMTIGSSAGGHAILVARVAAAGEIDPDKRPAVFIGANIDGYRLLTTEAALATIDYLIAHAADEDVAKLLREHAYYIAPVLNPDAMVRAFQKPADAVRTNATAQNDDLDLTTDEDGPDDLNGDGYITQMRHKDPEGRYIVDPADPRFMKRADPMKGEIGEYKLIGEGRDNDGDGEIDEDQPGGVIVDMNFPHDFQYFRNGAGPWPASEPETIAILDFMFAHRNIALVYVFGGENNLLNLQKGKQAAGGGSDMVRVPGRFARFLDLDPDQTYNINDLVKMLNDRGVFGGNITRERLAVIIGGGPVMSIPDRDYSYYEKIAEAYKEMIKASGVDDEKRKPTPALGDGSFVTWSYYQYGVPSFTVDLWAVPKAEEKKEEKGGEEELSVEKLKSMSADDFVALGEEKINAFIEKQGAGDRINAERLIAMVKGGQFTPERIARMLEARRGAGGSASSDDKKPDKAYVLDWAEKNVVGGGFVEWTTFEHPDLGTVEIGGMKPLIEINPPYEIGKPVLEPNAKFAVELGDRLASISFSDVSVKKLSDGIYEIHAFVRNSGFFPSAMNQGVTNQMVFPAVVSISVDKEQLVDGQLVAKISSISGNSAGDRMRWIVRAPAGTKFVISVESEKSGSDRTEVTVQ